MRAVMMDEDARPVGAVVSIATEVVAAVHHHTFPAGRRQPFGHDEAGKSGADDQEVGEMVGFQRMKGSTTLPPLVDPSMTEGNQADRLKWEVRRGGGATLA